MVEATDYPPVFYGEPDEGRRRSLASIAMLLGVKLSALEPDDVINIGIMLVVMGLHGNSNEKTNIAGEIKKIGSCALRSYDNLVVYQSEKLKENQHGNPF